MGLLAGCGSAEDAAHTRSGRAQAHAATAARATETPPSDQVRVLKEGKKLPVAISPGSTLDIPASSAVVTLTELKEADRLPNDAGLDPEVADPGTTFVCLEMKVKNTGSEKFDAYPLTRARWTGEDGETKNVDQTIGGDCAGLGMAKENLVVGFGTPSGVDQVAGAMEDSSCRPGWCRSSRASRSSRSEVVNFHWNGCAVAL
ncbi:hypothetical protein [Streptomyces sp. NBC_00209]|uniref:hypothetical protein n=1 Tax=Streptomyces sp. NBC_00209 TaxID=2975682 RepID=UPI003251736D